jgi:hypothetical protein
MGWRVYDAEKARKEFNGTLVRGNGNYYALLKDCNEEIDKYKRRQQEQK